MANIRWDKVKGLLTEFFLQAFTSFRFIPVNYLSFLIFLVIPVIYLLNVTVIHYSLGPFYMNHVDPEYFYMYNGVVLGAGNLSIQYFAHPGTPLHYMIMFSARIVDLFQPGDYMKGFVNDPEKYIHAANLLINIFIAIVLLFAGINIKKYTGSVTLGLIMQLVPFGSMELIFLSGRVFPEAIMIIPLILTNVLIIRYVYLDHPNNLTFKYEVFFGLIIGFGMAIKLTFIPVALIPLILLKNTLKQKIQYLFYLMLFFAIFAYPAVLNGEFWSWISRIFSHSGKYGTGAKEIINLDEVPQHFNILATENKTLFLICLAAFGMALLSLIPGTIKVVVSKRASRAIIAVVVSILTTVAFTLKHFSAYYFTPFNSFIFLLILLVVSMIIHTPRLSQKGIYKKLTVIITSALVIFLVSVQIMKIRSALKITYEKTAKMELDNQRIRAMVNPEKPIIISGTYFGSPFIEFAQFNGFIMSARLKGFYKDYLKEKYPDTYFFVNWSDHFNYWSEFVEADKVLAKTGSSFYIYTGKNKGEDLKIILERVYKFTDKNKVTENVLFQDAKTGEQLMELLIDKSK